MAGTVGKGFWKVNPLRIYGFVLQRVQTLFVLSCYKTIIWHWWLFWLCLYFNEWELHNSNFPMQILKWLRKDSASLFLPGEGGREALKVKQWAEGGNCVPDFGIHCAVLSWCTLPAFSAPCPKPSNITSPGQNQGKTVPKCFIPLVSVCLLTRLRSAIPFLKGLACFTWYILVPAFKSHIFSCRPQASAKWESVAVFSAFDVILKTNTSIERNCFTHYYDFNPLW